MATDERFTDKEDKSAGTCLSSNTPCETSPSPAINLKNVSMPESQVGHDSTIEVTTKEKQQKFSSLDASLNVDQANNRQANVSGSPKESADRKILSSKNTGSWWGFSLKGPTWLHTLNSLHSTLVGPEKEARPQKSTIVLSLVSFCLFLPIGGCATRYPTTGLRYAGFAVAYCLLFLVMVMVTRDFGRKGALIRLFSRMLSYAHQFLPKRTVDAHIGEICATR